MLKIFVKWLKPETNGKSVKTLIAVMRLRKIIRTRLLGQVFAVAGQIVDEEVCSLEDVDRGAKVGLRWARGPFELANRLGIDSAKAMAEDYCELANFPVPEIWKREEEFSFSYVDLEIVMELQLLRLTVLRQ